MIDFLYGICILKGKIINNTIDNLGPGHHPFLVTNFEIIFYLLAFPKSTHWFVYVQYNN